LPSRAEELRQAREHAEQASQRVIDQTALIELLRSDGHDTESAEQLLAVFIEVAGKLVFHRNRLERLQEERAEERDA
jgi:hypothetical protein